MSSTHSPDSDQISAAGHVLESLSARQRGTFQATRIAYVAQSFNLTHCLSAIGNINVLYQATSTPVNQTAHVKPEGIEVIHQDNNMTNNELKPTRITTFIVGLKSCIATFRLQKEINKMQQEPLVKKQISTQLGLHLGTNLLAINSLIIATSIIMM